MIKFGNKNELKDETYTNSVGKKVFVDEEDEKVEIYEYQSDKTLQLTQSFKRYIASNKALPLYRLHKNSFDVDFVSIPIKFRPKQNDVPAQLTANLSAAIFAGFRKDFHTIGYRSKPTGNSELRISNLGFAIGLVSGFGNTTINETTGLSRVHKEYDGIVWIYGVNGIVGWNQLSFGLAIGKDILTDNNRKYWIYNNQLWYGITIGLNLN